MSRHKIFVVEDDRSISGLYEIAFDKDEFEVVCFEKAEGMLDAFEKGDTCDVIILDLMLPGMSGLDALIHRYAGLITCVCLMGEGRNFRE